MDLRGRSRSEVEAFFENVIEDAINYDCQPPLSAPVFNGMEVNQYDDHIKYIRPLGSNGNKGHMLEREALSLGVDSHRLSKGAFRLVQEGKIPLLFKWSRSPISSAVSLAICTHKDATRVCLRRAGVPVPEGRMFRCGDYETAKAFAAEIGYPVVCKPAKGVRGIGVTANIRDEDELQHAMQLVAESRFGKDDFIIEKHVNGKDYRILVVDGKVIAAILREPSSVTGDGSHTIAELMVHKNVNRQLNPHLWGRIAKYDEAARYRLADQGFDIMSVPTAGQRVMLSNSCSLSQGGDSIDVLDQMHESIKAASVAAVKAVPGMQYCGVDFLLEDHTKPIDSQEAGICELNAHAAIGNCEYPMFGKPRSVSRAFVRSCLEAHGYEFLDQPMTTLSVKIEVKGARLGKNYGRWFFKQATNYQLKGTIVKKSEEIIVAELEGDTVPLSALSALAAVGPSSVNVDEVMTIHIPSINSTSLCYVDEVENEKEAVVA